MWQRKQTVFLVLAGLLCFATWLFPVATYERAQDSFTFRTSGLWTATGTELTDVAMKVPFHIILSLLGAALLFSGFLYGNRPRQIRFVRGTYVLMLGVIAFLFVTDNSLRAYLQQGGTVISHYGASFYFPLAVIVLAVLAERSIRADEALVKSVDRLR